MLRTKNDLNEILSTHTYNQTEIIHTIQNLVCSFRRRESGVHPRLCLNRIVMERRSSCYRTRHVISVACKGNEYNSRLLWSTQYDDGPLIWDYGSPADMRFSFRSLGMHNNYRSACPDTSFSKETPPLSPFFPGWGSYDLHMNIPSQTLDAIQNELDSKQHDHPLLNQWQASSICSNDILSSCFYTIGLVTAYAGKLVGGHYVRVFCSCLVWHWTSLA